MKHRIDIDMRGKQRDGETPLVCTPLVGRTRERLPAEAASVLRTNVLFEAAEKCFVEAQAWSQAASVVDDLAQQVPNPIEQAKLFATVAVYLTRASDEDGAFVLVRSGIDEVRPLSRLIADASGLEDGADRAARDDTGTHARRLEEHLARAEVARVAPGQAQRAQAKNELGRYEFPQIQPGRVRHSPLSDAFFYYLLITVLIYNKDLWNGQPWAIPHPHDTGDDWSTARISGTLFTLTRFVPGGEGPR